MIEVIRIPALQDNYIWMAHDPDSGETVVIDPAEAAPALAEAEKRGWTIGQIWNTHWHGDHIGGNAAIKAATGATGTAPAAEAAPALAEAEKRGWTIGQIWNTHWHGDHIGGNAAIKAATGATVTAPAAEAAKIATLDVAVGEGDTTHIGKFAARVIEVPAHTAGHIAYYLPEAGIAFVGDTLFAMGCGRLFEGTATQMWRNMERLGALPPETKIYCAHEYTQANGRYAQVAEPDNDAIAERMRDVNAARARGEATVPTTIALERATNPFMRAGSADELGRRRAEKDAFRG